MARMAIIGGGPAGLMAAHVLARSHEVHVYDHMRTIGRKFLVAGAGGFNLTNALDGEDLIARYSPSGFMRPIIRSFGSNDLRVWLRSLGIGTYVGSSGRVFPVAGIKPAQVLQAIRSELVNAGVHFHLEHRFSGFNEDVHPIVVHRGAQVPLMADRYFFALGGASWPSTGSTGKWIEAFKRIGIKVDPFRSSNCGIGIEMQSALLLHAGRPLKNISIACGDRTLRGECTITEHGLEGNAIYPLVPNIRQELEMNGTASITIDLKPDLDPAVLIDRLRRSSRNEYARMSRVDRPALALMKAFSDRSVMDDPVRFSQTLKGLVIPVLFLRPIEEAISSAGGIALEELDDDLSLKAHPHISIMGEMLDWDAPTGGFLLQGSFSTGYYATSRLTGPADTSIGRIDARSDE